MSVKTKTKRSAWRRWLRRLGIALGALLLLVVIAVGALHTGVGKGWVRGKVETALGKRVSGSVSIASIDYEFPFSNIVARGVEIRDVQNREAIRLDSLALSVRLRSLVQDVLVVESLAIDGLSVTAAIAEDGTSSLRGLFVKRKGASRKPLSLRSASIRGLRLGLTNAKGETVSLSDGQIALKADVTKAGAEIFLERASATFVASRANATVTGSLTQDGAEAKVQGETATVQLAPLSTKLTITQEGREDIVSSVSFSGGKAELSPESIHASLSSLVVGPLAVGDTSASLALAGGRPSGEQSVSLKGITIDTAAIAAIAARPLPVGTATGSIEVSGPPEALVVKGLLETPEGKIAVSGTVDISGDAGPVYDLSADTDIGEGVVSGLVNTPLRIGELAPTSLHLRLHGTGMPAEGGPLALELDATRVGVSGSTTPLRLRAHREGHSLEVDSLTLDLLGTEVSFTGAMDTGESGGDVSASLTVSGNAKEALAELERLGLRIRPRLRVPSELFLKLEVHGSPESEMTVTVLPSVTAIAGGRVRLQGEAVFAPNETGMQLVAADGTMQLRNLSLGGLARLARKPARARGRLSGSVTLQQRGARRTIRHNVNVALADFGLIAKARGLLGAGHWKGRASIQETKESEELAWLEGTVPLRTDRGIKLRKRGAFRVRAEVPSIALSEHRERLPLELREKIAANVHDANVSLSVDLEGTAQAPKGQVALKAEVVPTKDVTSTLTADLGLGVRDDKGVIVVAPSGTIAHSKLATPLAELGGTARIRISPTRPKESEVALDLHADLGKRSISEFANLPSPHSAKLAAVDEVVTGHVHVGGTAKVPELSVRASLGEESLFALALDLKKSGQALAVDVSTSAKDLEIAKLWPAFLPPLVVKEPLLLSSDLGVTARVELGKTPRLGELTTRGALALRGDSVQIPTSMRVWENLSVQLAGEGSALTLAVTADESDEQEAERTLRLTASAGVDVTGETPALAGLSARILTDKWLLFGGELGRPDGPRASLDADIAITGDLSGAVPTIDVTVNDARYWEPDREVFTHGFEDLAPTEDVNEAGDPSRPVGVVGPKLAAAPAPPAQVPTGAPKAMVAVHIPKPVTVTKGPLHLKVVGEIQQAIPSLGPTGEVSIEEGYMVFFGEKYPLADGSVELTGNAPAAKLVFERGVAPDILRGAARESSGETVGIELLPVGGGPLVSFRGAGNRSMVEMLSFLYTGHGYVLSPPDRPSSLNVRAPQGMHPTMIAFVKGNIPRLDLLDRFAVWSSPFDMHTSFGQLRNLDGSRFLKDGKVRLRLLSRPQQIGRSTNEAHLDRLLWNTPSVFFGVGLRAGTRLGGGAHAFFEWASRD